MFHMLCPTHLTDVYQAFDTFFELDKSTVIGGRNHLTGDNRTLGILLLDILPRVGGELLCAEGNTRFPLLVVQNLDLNGITDGYQFGRMADPAPGHIGDVQKTVDTAEIDKRAKIGNIFYRALANLADFQLQQNRLAHFRTFFLDDRPARYHDIPPDFINLDNLQTAGFTDVLVEIFHLTNINLRAGKERIDTEQINYDTALDSPDQLSFNFIVIVVNSLDHVPDLHEIGFLLGQDQLALLVFEIFQKDVDRITYLNIQIIAEFIKRD